MTIRTVTQFADITALNGRVQWGRRPETGDCQFKNPLSANDDIEQNPTQTSKAWIAGPVIGVLTAILLVLAGLWFLRRHRRQRFGRSAIGGNVNGKEEFIKAQLQSESIPRQPATDLEGPYPKGMPEMSANEIPAQQVLFSDGQHEEGVTGRNT
ncbi:hypothetical protein ColLi_05605 [Colletotrichum liriopes]|uniref:Uncharacterized protein n=1 Tax=Colletotrichum liriopes TaxID=708192 RepID=A0AA37LSH6_9PEZI|nr:hypothetical protein ColLi_05605 [Colletotrichum liriopes]